MESLPRYSLLPKKKTDTNEPTEVDTNSQCFDDRSVRSQSTLIDSHLKVSNNQSYRNSKDCFSDEQDSTALDETTEETVSSWEMLDEDDLPAFMPKNESDVEEDDFFSYRVESNQIQKSYPLTSANYCNVQTYENRQFVDQACSTSTTISSNVTERDLCVICPIEPMILDSRTEHEKN